MSYTDFLGRLSFGVMAVTNLAVAFSAFGALRKKKSRAIWVVAIGYTLGCIGTLLAFSMHYTRQTETARYQLWHVSTVLALATMGFCTIGTLQLIRACSESEHKKEPNQPPEPTAPSGRGSS